MQSSVQSVQLQKKHLHPDQENSSLSELNTIQLSANKCPNSVAKCQRTQKQMQARCWAVLFPPLPFIWIDHGLYHHLKSQIFSEAVFVDTPIVAFLKSQIFVWYHHPLPTFCVQSFVEMLLFWNGNCPNSFYHQNFQFTFFVWFEK